MITRWLPTRRTWTDTISRITDLSSLAIKIPYSPFARLHPSILLSFLLSCLPLFIVRPDRISAGNLLRWREMLVGFSRTCRLRERGYERAICRVNVGEIEASADYEARKEEEEAVR